MSNRYYTNEEEGVVIDLDEVVGIEHTGDDDRNITLKGGAVLEDVQAPGIIRQFMSYKGISGNRSRSSVSSSNRDRKTL